MGGGTLCVTSTARCALVVQAGPPWALLVTTTPTVVIVGAGDFTVTPV